MTEAEIREKITVLNARIVQQQSDALNQLATDAATGAEFNANLFRLVYQSLREREQLFADLGRALHQGSSPSAPVATGGPVYQVVIPSEPTFFKPDGEPAQDDQEN